MVRGRRRACWLFGAAIAAAAAASSALAACDLVYSLNDIQTGPCPAEGAERCTENGVPQICGADGQWSASSRCRDGAPLACNEAGEVKTLSACEESYPCVPETGRCRAKWIDLLLALDNFRSTAEKQDILAAVIPELVTGLLNPRCIDPTNPEDASKWKTPESPESPCPAGLQREHEPLVDMHIGIVSSSLGGHGADACADSDPLSCFPGENTSQNDKGHLLSRVDPCQEAFVQTYQDKGFLAWDPRQSLAPPGEADMGALVDRLRGMVLGVGHFGCGYPSQLESWYRFLVDPEPYTSIPVVNEKATPGGVDAVVLQQRIDFLRPDSVLMILMLSDKNDCSIKEYGQYYIAAQQRQGNNMWFHLPRPRSECATDPNSPCCKSCGEAAGDCPPDPQCFDSKGAVRPLTDVEDDSNVRCWDQKRRFGIDFLYEIDRYVDALTKPKIPNRAGELVRNPLFATDESGVVLRDKDRVFFGGVVGVPWQDIARDPKDLSAGTKSAAEMAEPVDALNGGTTWDLILGDPAAYVAPLDPHMIASVDPRAGVNPITGDSIAPVGSPDGTDPISGHEYSQPSADDLQYACIFPLLTPRDCLAEPAGCYCVDGANDNPLCAPTDPANPTTTRTMQVNAKAYPGLRELALIKALGPQGVVGSVCPKQLTDPSAPDYGYRPFVRAVFDAVKGVLPRPPALGAARMKQAPQP